MQVEIRPLKKRDFDKARKFSIDGMHIEWYTDKKFEIYLYSRYFWCWELSKATQILAAYIEDELAGVLLAEMYGEKKAYRSLWDRLYIRFAEFMMHLLFKDGASSYGEANEEMLTEYKKVNNPDGEMNFFVVDPKYVGMGIGTELLKVFEEREKGKEVFLFTDSGCTYQFYDQRGFVRDKEREIVLNLHEKEIPLTCWLFRKKLNS